MARAGSIISVVSVLIFLFILWESFASHRAALSRNYRSSSLEIAHTLPPLNHRYASIPSVIN